MGAEEHAVRPAMTDAPKSQEQRILWALQSAWPNWVPSPTLAKISLQYGARIFSARKRGWLIENRVRTVDGMRHGEFRLGSKPILPSAELRRGAEPPVTESLFPETERHRDDG